MDNSKLKNKEKMLLLPMIILMFAQMGTSGDNSILSVATASLTKLLNATTNDITLANMVYPLCAGSLMVFGGMFGIIIGWKNNFRLGLSLAIVGEILLAISSNMNIFIWGGRLLVGIGASFIVPSILGLVPCFYSGKEIAIAFGAIGAATGIASSLAPIVAGILIDKFNYKVGFGFMAIYFTCLLISSFLMPSIQKEQSKIKLDLIGTVVAAAGLFSLLIGISKLKFPLIILGMILLIVLIFIERKIEEKTGSALIPRSFIETRQVRNGLYASFGTFYYLGGMILPLQYLLKVAGYNAMQSGLISAAGGIAIFLFSLFTPKFLSNMHPSKILKIAYILMALGAFLMGYSFNGEFSLIVFLIATFIGGAGFGMAASQASTVVALATTPRDAKQSGGIQATSRNVGQAVSIAIVGIIFSVLLNTGWKTNIDKIDIDDNQKQILKNINMQLYNDDAIKELAIEKCSINDENKILEIININKMIRNNSLRNSLWVLSISICLFIFGTGGITKTLNKKEN